MKILVLAQNPKLQSNLTNPLKGTKSYTTFNRWLAQAGVPESCLEIRNAVPILGASGDVRTSVSTKLAKGGWIEELIGYPVIVCLGRLSEQAIVETRAMYFPDLKDWDHFFLPHPSGLNRKLNDPEEHEAAVTALRAAYTKLLTLKLYGAKLSG